MKKKCRVSFGWCFDRKIQIEPSDIEGQYRTVIESGYTIGIYE